MTCEQVQKFIGPFCDGELDDELKGQVEAHLKECAKCSADVHQLTRLERLLRVAPVESVPPEGYWTQLPEEVLRSAGLALKAQNRWPPRRERRPWFARSAMRWVGAAAAAVLIVLLGTRSLNHESGDQAIPPPTALDEVLQQAEANTAPGVVSEERLQLAQETSAGEAKPMAAASSAGGIAVGEAAAVAKAGLPDTTGSAGAMTPASETAIASPAPEVDASDALVATQTPDRAAESAVAALRGTKVRESTVRVLSDRADAQAVRPLEVTAAPKTYAGALWLSQSVESLEERERVWRSFLATQPDSIYFRLAIARLAAILAEMAEAGPDPAQVRRSLEFFEENQAELRRTVGAAYDLRVKRLRSLLAPTPQPENK
jgi:hypothetical protein